ncbi:MAG: SBBP repeat-containing protein [Acidobacteriota bacterium]|nr:SBBP repeat-containing protein [Acidobacteriota bacterium]
MKKPLYFLVILGILLGAGMAQRPIAPGSPSSDQLGVVPVRTGQVPDFKPQPNGNPSGLKIDCGSIPLYFTANKGQVDGKALFYAKASRYTLWLTEEGLVFDSFKFERPEAPAAGKGPSLRQEMGKSRKYERDVSRLVFLNASKHPEIVSVDGTALKVNYFIGNDPAKWHTAVPTSQAVLYKNIYNRIDLKVYGIESRIEYDWIVRPGGDPQDIRFQYENVKGTRVDEEGNLLVETGFGELMHNKPAAYQDAKGELSVEGQSANGKRAAVESAFKKIGENSYGFELGDYDAGQELVIDPVVLAYSTYLGGSGSDYGLGIAVDGSGNAYVTGYTMSTDFPTLNQYQQTYQGTVDVFVTKIDTTKSGNVSLLYSTYLGGNSYNYGYGIAADDSGNAYVTGLTDSTNFPTLNQYETDPGDHSRDVFVTKIDTTKSGNASLIYSTYLGGSGSDIGRGIAVDGSGNAYITGNTSSHDFPILNQYQTWTPSMQTAFVTKIDTTKSGTASLAYSTYLGSEDYGYGIAVDDSGITYVTGQAWGPDFPTLNEYQTSLGNLDAFVTKIDTTMIGSASLIYSTCLGGSSYDYGSGIAVDNSGIAYVIGSTGSTDFPTLKQCQTDQLDTDIFVTKLDTTKGHAGLLYSTYLGGNGYMEFGYGIAVDRRGNAYVTGYTDSTDFPTLNQYQTDQGTLDAFVTKIDTTKSGNASLIYSTYLGGSSQDQGQGIAVDVSGNAYVTGGTGSTDFPTLNQYQTDQEDNDAFITKITTPADISITKTSDNLEPKVGEVFNFTITATNGGPFDATGLQVVDPLPAGLAYISSSATAGTYDPATDIWNIGALANGGTATLTIEVKGTAAGAVTNTASVSALNETDPNPENDSASATVTVIQTYTLTISAGHGGTTNPVPGTYTYVEGTVVSVQAAAQSGYRFGSWSGDVTGSSGSISVTMNANKTVTANFIRVYELTITAGAGGTTNPVPGTYTQDAGMSVSVQAIAAAGNQFENWSGDAAGSANPVTIILDRDKAIRASFSLAVKPPLNLTGQRLTNRNLSQVEYVVKLQWQANGENIEPITYRIYKIEIGPPTVIANVGTGIYEYLVRNLEAKKAYRFGVTAVNGQGWESEMVEVAIQ